MQTATAVRQTTARATKRVSEKEILRHEFLTIAEVAILLRVSERTVYNLIYQGTLRATKVTSRVTIIPKDDFCNMIKINEYNRTSESSRQQGKEDKPLSLPVAKTVKKAAAQEAPKPRRPRSKPKSELKPSTDYKQSVKDTFIDSTELTEPGYTMEEICKKYSYTYGRFYNLRMRYSIPCVKMDGHKCFPRKAVEEAMASEVERLGKDLSEDWYSCFDLMKKYGIGKTQVRRFAMTHGVRMKKMYNRRMYYLKADWDEARKKAEDGSTSTKKGRG